MLAAGTPARERLFLVVDTHQVASVARRVNRLIRWQRHARGEAGIDVGVVSDLAERQFDDALTESLVRDIGDVVHLHAAFTFCGVEVFTAHLHT